MRPDRIAYTKETDFVVDSLSSFYAGLRPQMHIGDYQTNCPYCSEHNRTTAYGGLPTVDTHNAEQVFYGLNYVRWLGVPCHNCGYSFTLEMIEGDPCGSQQSEKPLSTPH